ncbi:hypothetical protein CMV_023330 [Castanea mollissima]|uniref:Uncharacterized protein n=1 Tax=Castanea mollissima TaxID=60419 RepID=A0A8J4QHU6_9ROSI|nr:hypothetical protein CMV_023330 [Castanea mollissima]
MFRSWAFLGFWYFHLFRRLRSQDPSPSPLAPTPLASLLDPSITPSSSTNFRLERERDEKREEIEVSGIDDVVLILRSDFENAYFVTGDFTSANNAEDCIFEDPTIRF